MVHFPNSADLHTACNLTIVDNSLCTYQTCCISEQGEIAYLPSFAGNVTYAALLAVTFLAQFILGIRYKTWTFLIWMSFGLFGEIVGYLGRVWLYFNIFSFNAFLVYLIPLTIAPAFITASIYLCLSRIILIYDPNVAISRLKPMTYTKIFVTFDFIALVLQGAGGGITATAKDGDKKTSDMGVDIMVAGLAFQVFSLIIFLALCLDFATRIYRRGVHRDITTEKSAYAGSYAILKSTRRFQGLQLALTTATVLILVRSIYRLAELQEGFNSSLANNQTLFMILEGPMIILSVIALTIFHPGFCLRDAWTGVFKTSIHYVEQVKVGNS